MSALQSSICALRIVHPQPLSLVYLELPMGGKLQR